MEFSGERYVPATREQVWQALNDPEVLRASIPGCEKLEKIPGGEFTAIILVKLGPVRARFKGEVALSDLKPPVSYKITGSGNGGVAGFGSGHALVELEASGQGTMLRYQAEAQIGGKLAQLGSRLVRSTVIKLSDAFFDKFARIVAGRYRDGSISEEFQVEDEPHLGGR